MRATAIGVDPSGGVYLLTHASSASSGVATTPGAFQPNFTSAACPSGPVINQPPCLNAFALKLNPGGSGIDQTNAVAVDSQGNAWITASTTSPDFPLTANAFESTFHGVINLGPFHFGDAFVAKLDPARAKLLYSTYLGSKECGVRCTGRRRGCGLRARRWAR